MGAERQARALTRTANSITSRVSVENQLPDDLYEAKGRFIAHHPHWDHRWPGPMGSQR